MNGSVWSVALALIMIAVSADSPARQGAANGNDASSSGWSQLAESMKKMHADMGSVQASGYNDVDFARLMVVHHQAAIDMARTELLYGKDPAIRRLAQEIVVDQQSEIELMNLWLTSNKPGSNK